MAAPTNNNTLTNLIPDAYAALDVVSRELTGFIPSVARDSRADMVAVGQTLRSIVAPVNSSGADITPAMAIPSALNQSIGNKSLTITKSRFYGFSWSGEDIMAVDKGPGYLTIQQDQIAQALRTAVNEIEGDIAAAASAGASRAFGATADTAPLISDFSQAKKILDDNGAPGSDRQAILSTAGGVAVRGFSNLFKVNEGGDTTLLRQGQLGDLYGFALRESAQVVRPTAGGMTGALVNGALSIGATAIVFDTGTVNTTGIVAGDIITIAGDSNKYVVATGLAAASGTITIAAPGLLKAAADNAAITVFGTSSRNCAFSRNAIVLATRLPAIPPQGDMAIDRQVISDPRTGLSFELAMYPGYRMNTYHVSIAWGITVFKPEHLAIIIGGV
jgi:hypothetical protein